MTQETTVPKPTLVKVCRVIFVLLSITAIVTFAQGIYDTFIVIQMGLVITSCLCLFARPSSQITYYLTSAALVALVLKALDSAARYDWTNRHDSAAPPFTPWLFVLAIGVLFWRFVFGRPSRQYYGFIPPTP